jgi:hypothetical protein
LSERGDKLGDILDAIADWAEADSAVTAAT